MNTVEPQAEMTCLDSILAQARPILDPVLDRMPEGLIEARRLITREFGFEPRAEELQLIVKLGSEEPCSEVRRLLPRQMLAVRISVEQALRDFWEAPPGDVGRLRQVADAIPELLEATREIERRFASLMDAREWVPLDDQDFLNQVAATLGPPEDQLVAAAVLASRLESIARIAAEDLRTAVPTLTQAEAAWLAASTADGAAGPSRVCVDALVLRTLLDDEYEFWTDAMPGPAGGEAEAARQASVQSFQRTETAYRVVGERLQEQQDDAISAGLDDFADDMRRIRGDLFSAYRRLATLVRSGGDTSGPVTEDQVVELREKAREVENAVAPLPLVQAAMPARSGLPAEPERVPSRDPELVRRRRKRRRIVLGIVAAALIPVGVAVHRGLSEPFPDPIAIGPSDFSQVTMLEETQAVGTLLYARILSWDDLDATEQLAQVNRIGRRAHERGFRALIIVDANRESVAVWDPEQGGRLSRDGREQIDPDDTTLPPTEVGPAGGTAPPLPVAELPVEAFEGGE